MMMIKRCDDDNTNDDNAANVTILTKSRCSNGRFGRKERQKRRSSSDASSNRPSHPQKPSFRAQRKMRIDQRARATRARRKRDKGRRNALDRTQKHSNRTFPPLFIQHLIRIAVFLARCEPLSHSLKSIRESQKRELLAPKARKQNKIVLDDQRPIANVLRLVRRD